MTSRPFPRFASSASAPSADAPRRASGRLSRSPAPRSRRLHPQISLAALTVALSILTLAACGSDDGSSDEPGRFDSEAAFELIEEQVALGPRPAGSDASRRLAEQLRAELPNGAFESVPGGLRNVVGALPGPGPAIVVGAHYDTEATIPNFVGANDGAAGSAAVLELARTLERDLPEGHREVRFVLFDGEEEPMGCPDTQFLSCALRGSRAYVAAHPGEVGEMILLDYVANQDLGIPREANSDAGLWLRLRDSAASVGAEDFFPAGEQPGVIDDHIPFIQAGVPSIDLIDFSYEYADTAEDTPDKLDPEALDAVGETVAELVIELASRQPSG